MNIDLQELFDQAGQHAPASSLDGDLVVRRGRRVRARRRAVVGTTTFVGVGVVALGSLALAGTLPSGGQGSTVVGPAAGGPDVTAPGGAGTPNPSGLPSPTGLGAPPTGLTDVSLPDPAPGFPIRREQEQIGGMTEGSRTYWVKTFLLASEAGTPTTDAAGSASSSTNERQVTLVVGNFPMMRVKADGTIEGHEVVDSPAVAGATGLVTTYSEKGTPISELYFDGEDFNVRVIGMGGVTTGELVDLGNAITGLH